MPWTLGASADPGLAWRPLPPKGKLRAGTPPRPAPDPVAVPPPSVLPLLTGGILSSGGIAGCFIRPDFMVQNVGNKSECRAITYWAQLLWGPGAGRQDPAAPGAGDRGVHLVRGTEES